MAYQTGSALSFSDFQTTIETFCTTNGWTKTGVVLKKGGSYIRLTNDTSNLWILGGTGESGGLLTGEASATCRISNDPFSVTFPATYYLFAHASPDTVICILNHDAVYFQWLAWGDVTKLGTYTGGNWYGATMHEDDPVLFHEFTATTGWTWPLGNPQNPGQPSFAPWWLTHDAGITEDPGNCLIHCDLDSNVWNSNSSRETHAVYSAPMMAPLVQYAKSEWNEQTVLVPSALFMKRPSGFRSLIGRCEHFRFCRVDNYSPGDIITIGSDKWKLFPFWKKDLDDSSPYASNTGPYGWAISYDGP